MDEKERARALEGLDSYIRAAKGDAGRVAVEEQHLPLQRDG